MFAFFSSKFQGSEDNGDEKEDAYQNLLSDLQEQAQKLPKFTEEEKIFANLLVKSDFTKEEISEIMEYDPDQEEMGRINTLVEKAKNPPPVQNNFGSPYSTTFLF